MKLSFTRNLNTLPVCGMFSLVQQDSVFCEPLRIFSYIWIQLVLVSLIWQDVAGPVFKIHSVDGLKIINRAENCSSSRVGGWVQAEVSPSQFLPKNFHPKRPGTLQRPWGLGATHSRFIASYFNVQSIQTIKQLDYFIAYLIWGRGEVWTGFWWGNLRERDHWEDPGVEGRIILRWIFRK